MRHLVPFLHDRKRGVNRLPAVALLVLTTAVALSLATGDLGFLPFLLMLIGGLLIGIWFVGVTFRMRRVGALVHTVVVIVAGAVMFAVIHAKPDLSGLPEWSRAVIVTLQLALNPAWGWTALALLSRVTHRVTPKAPVVALRLPEWTGERDRRELRVPVLAMTMRQLTLWIVGAIVLGATLVVPFMIVIDPVRLNWPPQLVIIAIGVIALPIALAARALLARRTVDAVISWRRLRLEVVAGGRTVTANLADIRLLRWRRDSDYARVEVHTVTESITLLAGIARVPKGVAPQLPALPPRFVAALEAAGLIRSVTKRGVEEFVREG